MLTERTEMYQDHPRLRGEYKGTLTISTDEQGSPPLARGILVPIIYLEPVLRITPACAGNT